MTQKNSSFKLRSLIRHCCGRQAALFTVSILGMLITLPVYMILGIQSRLRYFDTATLAAPQVREEFLNSIQFMFAENGVVNAVLILLALIAGIATFRYLHVRNQTDFFHALPITRSQMFIAHVLTGILAVIPAYLIGVILSYGVCAAYGFSDAITLKIAAYSIFAHIAGFLFIYAVTILAAVVSGNTLVSILVCGWFQLGLAAGLVAVCMLIYTLYPARPLSLIVIPYGICPPAGLFQTTSNLYLNASINGIEIDYFKEILLPSLVGLIAALIILFLSWKLNQIRKSENTGLAIAFPIIEVPFKLYMVSVCGILCGIAFESITGSWTVMFLGIALGGLIASCIVEIVYNLDFHSLFNRWKSLLVYSVLCALVLACMAMDITHWNTALPDREDITGATVVSNVGGWNCGNNDNYFGDYGTSFSINPKAVYDIMPATEQPILTSAEAIDAIYDSAKIGAKAMAGDRSIIKEGADHSNYSYTITFQLQNGKAFTRVYYMPYKTEQLVKNGASVRFSKEYQENYTKVAKAYENKENYTVMLVGNYLTSNGTVSPHRIENKQAITAILDSLKQESLSITKDYAANHAPILKLRVASKNFSDDLDLHLDDFSIGVSDFSSRYSSTPNIPVNRTPYDLPVYECQQKTLAILHQYIANLETGFGSAQIESVMHVTYSEGDGSQIQKVYSNPELLEQWKTKLIPLTFNRLSDPVLAQSYMRSEEDSEDHVIVTLVDGPEMDCYIQVDLNTIPSDGEITSMPLG